MEENKRKAAVFSVVSRVAKPHEEFRCSVCKTEGRSFFSSEMPYNFFFKHEMTSARGAGNFHKEPVAIPKGQHFVENRFQTENAFKNTQSTQKTIIRPICKVS